MGLTSHELPSRPARELLALLRFGAAAGLPPDAGKWDEIAQLALLHGVAPLLHRALRSPGARACAPPPVCLRLEEERRATALHNLRNYGELQRIANAFRARGIPVIALKGLHLAELVYRDISLRPMSDLDILVPRPRVEQAIAILRELQYGFDADLSQAVEPMLASKCNFGLAANGTDTWLEVHWSLGEPPGQFTGVIEEIWRTAVPGRLGDTGLSILSIEFLLLHVCAHLACGHQFAFSLRALCDIAEIARQPGIRWEIVIDHAQRHGWQRGVAAALRLAHEHLGAEVPPQVLEAIGAHGLDQERLDEAMEHLLACVEMPAELKTAPNLLAAAAAKGPRQALELLWKRVFIPRAELALLYGVPPGSARLPFLYLVRLGSLLRTYAGAAWAMTVSDPVLAAAAARHARLEAWLKGS